MFVCSIHIAMENLKNPNGQYHYSAKLLSNKLSNYYSNAYKKHWNNSGKIGFLNVILLTWDIILFTGSTEFHMYTICTYLHNFQVDILSNKVAILRRCTLKELRSKLATMLRMCCYRWNFLWCMWSETQWSTHPVVFLTL